MGKKPLRDYLATFILIFDEIIKKAQFDFEENFLQ